MPDGKVVIDTALNNKGFTNGIKSLKADLGGLKSALGGIGKAIGVAFGVAALVSFSKKAIELGSNVAEVQNVVDVAFGEMSYKIEEFSKTAIQSFGMSQLAAKKTASTYMAMARGMGIQEGVASDMAISLTGLTGDVASFYNISQELADTKLKSVFTGETETLKDLGVVMTQTNLKAYALSQGISKDIDKMTQAELVGLRYNFVLEQLSLANGDFARTSDSWANQTRILSMQWEEFMSIVGQALITVLKPLVQILNDIVASMIQVATSMNQVMTALFGGEQAQSGMTEEAEGTEGAIGGSVENQEDLTGAIKDTEKEQKKSLATFDEINKLTGEKKTNAGTSPDQPSGNPNAPGKEVEGLASKLQSLVESIKKTLGEISDFAKQIWTAFAEAWEQSGQKVIDAAKTALNSIMELVRSIGSAFAKAWDNGTGVAILNTIYSIIAKVLEIVSALAERFRIAWEASGNGQAIWQSLLNIFQLVLSFIDRIVSATLVWAQGLNLEPIVSAFRRFLAALEPLVAILLDGLAWAYENVLLPLASWVIEDAAPAVMDLLTAALGAFTEILVALQPLAIWLWENFLLPLGQWTGEVFIDAIHWITERLNEFTAWARENPEVIQKMAEVVLAFLAGIVAYYTVNKIVEVVKAIQTAFLGLAAGFNLANVQAGLAVIAFAAIAMVVMELVRCWDQMSGIERVVAILGVVTAAAFAAAIAIGAFQSAMTLGIAAVAIAAGIAAVVAAISSAQSRVGQMSGSFGTGSFGTGGRMASVPQMNVPRLAQGAVIPPNQEFLAVLGDQKSGRNIEAPESVIEEAAGRAVERVMGRMGGVQKVELVVTAGPGFVRNLKIDLDEESKRRGIALTRGGG